MTEIKTKHGTFGRFKDLYKYMCEENINETEVSLYYNFDLLSRVKVSKEELQSKLENGQLI